MKSSAKKVELASVDDLFSTEESRADAQREKVMEIPLSELHPFKNHPFKVKDDEAMMETADSVRKYGVLVPAIARPDPDGGYELVAGHRRHRASELAEKETMPVIVRDLDDDAATIIMVDSNLQREELLPSERAFAYKMKLEAIKHQGERSDLTSRQVGEKSQTSIQLVANQAGESQRQVQRYIRLGVISMVFALLGVAVLITYSPQNGIILMILAFLISPFGLPKAAIWMLGKVQDLKYAIQDKV
ncbi:CD1845 family protein, partial [uncultured Bacteroides sp.]|uniref:CD1845 family protein n=1 Tax=uncultured Bacteroides sp. TaxID=162156 RepID=UPI002598A2B8